MIAPTLRQSQELFGKAMQFYRAAGRPVPLKNEATLKCEFENGSRIICLPDSDEAALGFTCDLLLIDEASKVRDSTYHALRPTLAVSGGRIVLMSTPAGTDGFFAKAFLEETEWKKFKIDATQCPRISQEFLAAERQALGDYLYQQEYFGLFASSTDVRGFVNFDDYNFCLTVDHRLMPCLQCGARERCEHKRIPNKGWLEAPLDVGLDVARSPTGDLVCFAFAKGNMLLIVNAYPGQPITQTCGKCIQIIQEFGPRSIRIDDGACGGGVLDNLWESQEAPDAHHHLKQVEIIPVSFGSRAFDKGKFFDLRTEMWWSMGQQIQMHSIGLPQDARLFSQVCAPAMLQARDGRLRLESKDSLRARGIRSPDHGDAAAMALYPHDCWPRAGCAW